jgi:hypothetical protein
MSLPRVILCERTMRWASALARHLPADVLLQQTRSLGECTAELAASPTSLVALEVTAANLSGVVPWLARLPARYPRACVIALADRELPGAEWLLREAGALHVTVSPRELQGIAGIVKNHLARLPAPKTGVVQQLWDTLPWSQLATS